VAYQLAVVADDLAMAVSHVLRGRDLLSSTPRQILLYRALGATPPAFAHAPLLVSSDGAKLSKRNGGAVAEGFDPREVLALLSRLAGLSPGTPATAADLLAGFDLERLRRLPPALTLDPGRPSS